MRKCNKALLCLICVLSLTACNNANPSNGSTATEPAVTKDAAVEDTKAPAQTEETTKKPDSNKGDKIEAGLGDLKIYYNDTWTYDHEQSENQSLAFTKGKALFGIVCSQEATYQHPLSMMTSSLNMVSQTEGYKLLKEPTRLVINGEVWYECQYERDNNGAKEISIQRCYGKNYYAYTATYTAIEDDFEKYKDEAVGFLDSIVMNVPDNKDGQAAAMKDLVGEYDAGDDGYLVLNDDNTYYWYMESSKSMDYVHYGTYACDNKITSMNISSGNGYYIVLYPEHFITDSKESDMGTPKLDFAISKKPGKGDKVEMINMLNYKIYNIQKVK